MEKTLIVLLIILLALLAKGLKQDFFSPATINIYWNSFFIIGAVVIFGGEIEWRYEGIFWILGFCVFCLFGQYCGSKVRIHKIGDEKKHISSYVMWIIIALIVISMLNPYIYIKSFGYSVRDIFQIEKLLQLNAEVAYDRYYGHQFQKEALQTIISTCMYFSAVVGGYAFNFQKKIIGKAICVAIFFPCIVFTIITNGKLAVIAPALLWITGWLLSFLNIRGEKAVLSRKMFLFGAVALIGGILFLYFSMLLRYGGFDSETREIADSKMQEYMFGQVQAFTVWFSGERDDMLKLGASTYMFVPNWLGLTKKIQGVYEFLPGVSSNIFTQNRGIIEDFGIVGGWLYGAVVGVISGIAYKMVKSQTKHCWAAITILGAIYFSVLYGFIISPWIYSTYVVTFIGFAIFLAILQRFHFCIKR